MGIKAKCDDVPWFWSDQFETYIQIAGLCTGATSEVVRRGGSAGAFSVFYFKDEALIAVDSVNAPPDHMVAKRLLARRAKVAFATVSDSSIPLKSLL